MNNSRDRVYADWSALDRKRSVDQRDSATRMQSDVRNRYAQSPSPVTVRREISRPKEDFRQGSGARYTRLSVDVTDRTGNIDTLNQQITVLEAKNKQLFEQYSRNDKRVGEIVRNAKEDNQALLSNLKKLLVKPVINNESLANNPVRDKLIMKLAEMKAAGNNIPIAQPKQSGQVSNASDSISTESAFIIQELSRGGDCRGWVSALNHAKTLVLNTTSLTK
jgi:uncharacterized protein YdcH (DUF465 family)